LTRIRPQFRAVLLSGAAVLAPVAPGVAQTVDGEAPIAQAGLGLEGSLLNPLLPQGGLSSPSAAGAGDNDTRFAITLRGQYTINGESRSFTVSAIPQAGIRYDDGRLDMEAQASVELVHDFAGDPQFAGADAGISAEYALDRATQVAARGTVRIEEDDTPALDASPSGAMTAPLAFTGDLEASITRDAGTATITALAGVERGFTLDDEADEAENRAHTNTTLGLRLGQELAPALVGFVAGGVTRSDYDTADADSWHYTASAGLAGEWRQLSGEVQVGSGWRSYDAPTLSDTQSLFFAASLAYLPTANLSLRASYASDVLPFIEAESGTEARQQNVVVEAAYEASSWLGLSADASYLWELEDDGSFAYERYTAGLGADVTWFPHALISAGYSYSVTNAPSAASANEHRVTLGVTLER